MVLTVAVVAVEDKGIGGELTIEVVERNTGSQPCYVMTRPVRSNGDLGPYVSVDPAMPSQLIVAERLFSLPSYEMFKNDASIHLEPLLPGASRTERMTIKFPTRATVPPYAEQSDMQMVRRDSIRTVQVQVGVLPSSDPLMALIRRKGSRDLFNGLEQLEDKGSGRSLYSEQSISTSSPVGIKRSPHP